MIGEATRRLVRDAVTGRAARPRRPRRRRTAPAWRLLELLAGAPPFQRRFDAPLVGREGELAQLRQAFERAQRERRAQLFTVFGEAGIGKTRLAQELARSVEAEASVLIGRCLSYGEGITYWPVREIVAAGGRDRSRPRAARRQRRMRTWSPRAWRARSARARAAPSRRRSSGRCASSSRRSPASPPLVLVFEDVHWAEPTLLDLIEHLADWVRDAPVLHRLPRPAGAPRRQAGLGRRQAERDARSCSSRSPATDSSRLIGALPPGASWHPRRARGSPPPRRETRSSSSRCSPCSPRARRRWREIAVPPAIQALLAARLDRLEPEERRVLECASIEGETFHVGGVVELSPAETREAVESRLLSLVRKELIRPEPADAPGGGGVPLPPRPHPRRRLRGAAEGERAPSCTSATPPGSSRRSVSAREARSSSATTSSRPTATGPSSAGSTRGLELADRAGVRLASAGRLAFRRGDTGPRSTCSSAPARCRLRRAGLARARPRPRLRAASRPASSSAPRPSSATPSSARARSASASPSATPGSCATTCACSADPDADRPRRGAARGRGVARECSRRQATTSRSHARGTSSGTSTSATGEAAPHREAAERALEHARRAGSRLDEAWSLALLGYSLLDGPTPVAEGVRDLRASCCRAQRAIRLGEAMVSAYLAPLLAMQGRFEDARALIARSRAEMQEFGMGALSDVVELCGGRVETLAGDRGGRAGDPRGGGALGRDRRLLVLRRSRSIDLARAVCDQDRPPSACDSRRERAPPGAARLGDRRQAAGRPGARACAARAARGGRDARQRGCGLRRAERSSSATTPTRCSSWPRCCASPAGPRRPRPRSRRPSRLFERKGNVVSAASVRAMLEELR